MITTTIVLAVILLGVILQGVITYRSYVTTYVLNLSLRGEIIGAANILCLAAIMFSRNPILVGATIAASAILTVGAEASRKGVSLQILKAIIGFAFMTAPNPYM
jgi:hypothetical protein